MNSYSNNIILRRTKILQSHVLFGRFLTMYRVNSLACVFDDEYTDGIDDTYKMSIYVEQERHKRHLSNSNVQITGEVYKHRNNFTLFLSIKKNNNDFIHLSIHLNPNELNPKKEGMIHFVKDIYTIYDGKKKIQQYALISVDHSSSNSLHFAIATGYNTPGVYNASIYDHELQQEMDVIIAVLNRMFDEYDNELYIGKSSTFYSIHHKTNSILSSINYYTKIYNRTNKGNMAIPFISNAPFTIKTPPSQIRKKPTQLTRKKQN